MPYIMKYTFVLQLNIITLIKTILDDLPNYYGPMFPKAFTPKRMWKYDKKISCNKTLYVLSNKFIWALKVLWPKYTVYFHSSGYCWFVGVEDRVGPVVGQIGVWLETVLVRAGAMGSGGEVGWGGLGEMVWWKHWHTERKTKERKKLTIYLFLWGDKLSCTTGPSTQEYLLLIVGYSQTDPGTVLYW